MQFYLDSDFRVHLHQSTENDRLAWDDLDGMFEGKCEAYINGYRVVPVGHTWTQMDGVTITGLMIAPAVDAAILDAAQTTYLQIMQMLA